MKRLNRPLLMKLHLLLAALILPIALMYFITGALYTWDITGSYRTIDQQEIVLKQPLSKDLDQLRHLAEQELAYRNIPLPTGQTRIKQEANAFKFDWSGSHINLTIKPTANPLIAHLDIKKTNGYQRFVQLHKAKGGMAFKFYAVFFAISLLLLLISGFIMAWQMVKLRKLALTSSVLGLTLFIIMVFIS